MEQPPTDTTAAAREWSLLKATGLAWLMPATATRHTARMSLPRAFASHLVGAVLVFAVLEVAVATSESLRPTHRSSFFHELGGLTGELIHDISRYPEEAMAVIAGTVAAVGVGYLVSALILMSWGAADEPIRQSFRNALRQLWLHTFHVAVAIALASPLFIMVERTWALPVVSISPPPMPPKNASPGSPEWDEYQAELEEYNSFWQRQWESRPWLARHGEELLGYVSSALGTWILWSLMRGIGGDRGITPIPRPPTCEYCGYNLTATPMDSRCPECGTGVLRSLGPDVRPGTPWQRRRELGGLRAGWHSVLDPIVYPGTFGRGIQAVVRQTVHRMFLASSLPVVFLMGAVGFVSCVLIDRGPGYLARHPDLIWAASPFVGFWVAVAAFFMPLLAAVAVGMWYGVTLKRNLMATAIQASSYLAGYLVLWAFLSVALAITTVALEGAFSWLGYKLPIDDELLAFCFWLVPNLVLLLVYVALVWRATSSTRYANH